MRSQILDAIRRKYLNAASHYSWFGDVDSSEMFHNYTLSEKAQPYVGVDFYWVEKGKALKWEEWTRMATGIFSSPFSTTRIFVWVMEVIMGDQKDRVIRFIAIQESRTSQELMSTIRPFKDCIGGTQNTRSLHLRARPLQMICGQLRPHKSYPGMQLIVLRQSWDNLACRTHLENGSSTLKLMGSGQVL